MNVRTSYFERGKGGGGALVLVVDAEPAAEVDVLEVEALLLDLLHKLHHYLRGVLEDAHLRPKAPQNQRCVGQRQGRSSRVPPLVYLGPVRHGR